MITTIRNILISLAACVSLAACHGIEEWDNDARGNFEALWTIIDQRYCFFNDKNIDWDECHRRYGARIYDGMSREMLFQVCADMLDELKDGHVNLSASFNTSYYTKWWSDYPQNYDSRLVREHYLGFDAPAMGGVRYAILRDNVGYISYPSFETSLGDGNIDLLLNYMSLCTGLIIDLRDNGGGALTASEKLARRFVQERTLASYIINKTGPGHDDLSKPFEQYIEPAKAPHILWDKPMVVLTNRSTFSAANNFVSMVRYLPNVRIVGAQTGGGSGMPLNMELPCGWGIRLSAVSFLDAKKQVTEYGIPPSPGCEVDLDPVKAIDGIDTMIERAVEIIKINCKIVG